MPGDKNLFLLLIVVNTDFNGLRANEGILPNPMSPLNCEKAPSCGIPPAFWLKGRNLGYVAPEAGSVNREYDIFERLPDGTDLWKDYVVGLEEARRKLQELAAQSKNEHYAIHTPTKDIAARVNVRQA